MYVPTLKEYIRLFKGIFTDVILKYNYVKLAAVLSTVSVFISTYYFMKVAEASSVLLEKSSTIPFATRLAYLVKVSLLSLCLKHIPLSLFAFITQLISRDKFIENLKSYMNLTYTSFHSKTPGEIRFNIFLKSQSYAICPQIVIFDFTGLIGTSLFTFIKAYRDINIFAALLFLLFPIFYGIVTLAFLKYRIIYYSANLAEQQKTSARIYDKLSNYDVIKTYNMENEEIGSFKGSLKNQVDCQLKLDMFIAKSRYLIRFVTISPYLIFGLFCFLKPGAMNGKTLFQAILLYNSLSSQIKRLGSQLVRLASLLNQIRFDSIDLDTSAVPTDTKTDFNSSIRFENVNLYHGEKLIIKNINLTLNKGEKVAVIGKNGTGKSTFIKSLFRFTKFTGKILIDDVDIKTLSNKSIFDLIAYIPQDDFTSDDTIINNLRLGKKGCTMQEIIDKSKLMNAHDTFEGLDQGYETEAGIKGHKLSGGQKQKLSLVRAALKDSPIFILDEATAAIDKGYEVIIMNTLLDKMEDKSLVMIIHNKEYLKRFDKIVFLDDGIVGGYGRYDELLSSNNEFKSFMALK